MINPEVKRSVAFVFVDTGDGNLMANGTGFFVGVRKQKDTSLVDVYFATAKHVIQISSHDFYKRVYLRLNKLDGRDSTVALPVFQEGQRYISFSPDSTVDIAVFPFAPDQNKFEFTYIPIESIAPKDAAGKGLIKEGFDAAFCGLFTNYFGAHRNYPIFRFGKIALLTDERVEFQKMFRELYLVETASYGGNSGSPVFFFSPLSNSAYLGGIMLGYFGVPVQGIALKKSTEITIPVQNAGIAAVIPAYLLLRILNSPELKRQRGEE